jgi:hypothetical protein
MDFAARFDGIPKDEAVQRRDLGGEGRYGFGDDDRSGAPASSWRKKRQTRGRVRLGGFIYLGESLG